MYPYNKKSSQGKRVAAISLAFIFVFSSLISSPQKAQAAVPTLDVGLNPITATVIAPSVAAVANKETLLDGIIFAAKDVLVQNILQSIVTWAKNGFNGGPSFIQDPEGFLRNVGDQTAGLVIQDIAPFLCEPFRISLQSGLSLSYSMPVFDKIECTLSDVIENIDGFLGGDFSAGGWDGWFSMTQNKRNNPYGAFLLAQSELNVQVAKKQGTQLKFLDWGQGFFSVTDATGNVVTPGALISGQINKALGAGQDELVSADEITEVISAVLSGLISNLLNNGNGFLGL